jgi:hypothetical protein
MNMTRRREILGGKEKKDDSVDGKGEDEEEEKTCRLFIYVFVLTIDNIPEEM